MVQTIPVLYIKVKLISLLQIIKFICYSKLYKTIHVFIGNAPDLHNNILCTVTVTENQEALKSFWKCSLCYVQSCTLKTRTHEQTTKPQTNYHCCLQFSYLSSSWLLLLDTITFQKHLLCSRFSELDSKYA